MHQSCQRATCGEVKRDARCEDRQNACESYLLVGISSYVRVVVGERRCRARGVGMGWVSVSGVDVGTVGYGHGHGGHRAWAWVWASSMGVGVGIEHGRVSDESKASVTQLHELAVAATYLRSTPLMCRTARGGAAVREAGGAATRASLAVNPNHPFPYDRARLLRQHNPPPNSARRWSKSSTTQPQPIKNATAAGSPQ
jgi:hypothetical protein